MEIIAVAKPFSQLTPYELYAVLRLRNEIFVVEQNCVFQDADNKDQGCHHLMLFQAETLIAYARLVPAGLAYSEISIGRIVTSAQVRGSGVGRILMTHAIDQTYKLFGKGPIRIGAQLYATAFYQRFGFVPDGPIYDEDGIDHVQMLKVI
ncbi:GNAT family N-acetyltransferase [Adhaeribacter rhizoryzae]|uniref:GNAT family N-acetyltransferase n=1 Tax=Adhaeribacter rhizoryzae TaxID=2607907 RepID=A0A5M6DPV7_9BACT|nr:GNAT family N-acetyltransferase [Adhaeribacter rhizoryzae]KAA5547505.1 GNAT family N-acetyltransferase [Adhaeribacter rhizoryzae]